MMDSSPRIYTVGTLSYTQRGLWLLFFWLMWNDFTLMLMEQVNFLNNLLLQHHGASYTAIAAFGSVAGIAGMWINPVFSTWSDRLRTRWGRRRPILFISVPVFALSLSLIPFAPDLYRFLIPFKPVAWFVGCLPVGGEVFFIGSAVALSALCNAVVMAIFSYFYWDVVPETVLGRFQAMARNVTVMAGMAWNFFIFGHAQDHSKLVYAGVAVFCTAIYLLSIWQVKEGEYPPPEKWEKKSPLEPLKIYFKDCYAQPFYLWVFIGTLFLQTGNKGNDYILFYLLNDLKLSYAQVGWINGWGSAIVTGFGLVCGFSVGAMVDWLKPIRIFPAVLLLKAVFNAAAFVFVKDKNSALAMAITVGILDFFLAVIIGALTVELFPREKLGQFCSAQAFFYQAILTFIHPLLIGPFFDRIQFNRAGYLWLAAFYLIGAAIYLKVFFNWRTRSREGTGQKTAAEISRT